MLSRRKGGDFASSNLMARLNFTGELGNGEDPNRRAGNKEKNFTIPAIRFQNTTIMYVTVTADFVRGATRRFLIRAEILFPPG